MKNVIVRFASDILWCGVINVEKRNGGTWLQISGFEVFRVTDVLND